MLEITKHNIGLPIESLCVVTNCGLLLCLSVPAGDSRFSGIPDLWKPAPQPVWLCGSRTRGGQGAHSVPAAWRHSHGGHPQGGRGASGRVQQNVVYFYFFFFFVEDKTWAAWLNCGYWLNHLISAFSLFQGVTFKVEAGELTIARILHGGIVDQQGLLHVGDVIKEVRWSKAGSTECTGWLCWDRHPFLV